ncbi:nuclear transport factor 2 family protein [Pedobacter panaciterrae]|uniref:nuclear transport factor 2 family protein n=1 Tax=Pedobacter panaciterrae TaxID=363849 RepID=UPI00259AAADB|nr:nuclear transport factor 2 family protein [uncultured Pedobacter sp.]
MKNSKLSSMQDLALIEEIKRMKSRYCRYVDTKQWEKLAGLMDKKISMDFRDPEGKQLFSFDNRKDMISLTSSMLEKAVTVHHVHNPEIELLSSDSAKAIWAMEDLIAFPEDAQDAPFKVMHGFGHYHERLERTTDGWIIKSLKLHRLKLEYTY